MNKLYGDRLQVFLDWYQQEHNGRKLDLSKQIDRELLINFYQQKKGSETVTNLINKEFQNPIDLVQEDIILLRKVLGLKKYVPFDALLKLVFRDRGNGNEKLMKGSYEEEMVFLKNKFLKQAIAKDVDIPLTKHFTDQQLSTWHKELVSNAIDASSDSPYKIGRFGKGFLSVLGVLGKGAEEIKVSSSTGNGNGVLSRKKIDGELMISSDHDFAKCDELGTQVQVMWKMNKGEQDQIITDIQNSYKNTKNANIILNGKFIHSKKQERSTKDIIITVNEHGLVIQDQGVGMNAEAMLTKLIVPHSGSKEIPVFESKEQFHDEIAKDHSRYYKSGNSDKTNMGLELGGVLIQTIELKNMLGVQEVRYNFPAFSYLPESRDVVVASKEICRSLRLIIDEIMKKPNNQDKLKELSIMAELLEHLKNTQTVDSVVDSDYDIFTYCKVQFSVLARELSDHGTTVLPYDPRLENCLGSRTDICFVNPLLYDRINPEMIAHTKLCDTILYEGVIGKKKKRYRCEFDTNADHDYYIGQDCILINKRFESVTQEISLDGVVAIHALNAGINAKTGYEYYEDRITYGELLHVSNVVGMDDVAAQLPINLQKKKRLINTKVYAVNGEESKKIEYSEEELGRYNTKRDELILNTNYQWRCIMQDLDNTLSEYRHELLNHETLNQKINCIQKWKRLDQTDFEIEIMALISSYKKNSNLGTLGERVDGVIEPLKILLSRKDISNIMRLFLDFIILYLHHLTILNP